MNTLIVSIFGGPGAGKSAFAHGLMYELKVAGVHCEYSSEYAKDIYYEESPKKLKNQLYVFGKQLQRLRRVMNDVDVVVTDAPLIHSIHYEAEKTDAFKNVVLNEHNKFDNFNIFLSRKHDYNPKGRFQDERGAAVVTDSIEQLLHDLNIDFHRYDATRENVKIVSDIIIEKVQYNVTTQQF